ncbi:Rhodanese-like domain-containing protein [Trichoderma austrokoningii]
MAFSTQEGGPLKFEEIPPSAVSCDFIEPSDVYESIESVKTAGQDAQKDFLLVDVRRTDWEGGTVATSVNLPAQSFYQTRGGVYQLCKHAGIKKVIFYCGSCGTRGPKCAGWFQEYLDSIGETEMKAFILRGGVKGWQKMYNGQLMDYYDSGAWGSQSE